jgi:hypothetical protein
MRSFSIRSLSALALVASAMVSLHANAQQQCSEPLLQPDVKIDFLRHSLAIPFSRSYMFAQQRGIRKKVRSSDGRELFATI